MTGDRSDEIVRRLEALDSKVQSAISDSQRRMDLLSGKVETLKDDLQDRINYLLERANAANNSRDVDIAILKEQSVQLRWFIARVAGFASLVVTVTVQILVSIFRVDR